MLPSWQYGKQNLEDLWEEKDNHRQSQRINRRLYVPIDLLLNKLMGMRTCNSTVPVEAITNQWPPSSTWWQSVSCFFLLLFANE
ncbi:hypothetical protein SADUNF_Sadunf04G0046300 [Salix dunnii]|uniref:Uncharacterized protein n=1 Tax=Salix dunnii TaxID=1413687 RepID=A0A835K5Z9_9ROSI|nr:hypothetical protein SADUNF_Sadunf04G0046300 [Salix dunnii]